MKIYDQNIWGNFSAENCVGNRNLLIKEMINNYRPDICCFQECNPKTSRSGDTPIAEILKPDFVEVYPEVAYKNFTPVFYNRNTTELIESGYKPFEGFNDGASKSITWGVFKDKTTDKIYCVASAHFWYMARDKGDEEQRKANADEAVKILSELHEKYDIPVFLTGDLNSSPIVTNQGMGGYDRLIELGMTDAREIAQNTDYSHTCSNIYPILNDGIYIKGAYPDFTLDYMLVFGKDKINAKNYMIDNSDIARASSDHSPLIFEFEIK